MADRHHVAGPHEDVRLADLQAPALGVHPGRAQHDEEAAIVELELGPLVRAQRVLDGQVVQPELLLYAAEQGLFRLVEPDPDEGIGVLLEDVADLG